MKKSLLSLPILLISSILTAQTTPQVLDSFMRAAAHAHIFNGTVLVARHDSILLEKGYGCRDAEKHILHDSLSVFQIGSLTKSFTATCILQQAELGHLHLSDTLGQYFPAYKTGAGVTIEQVLNHTGGIWEYSNDHAFMASIYTGHFTEDAFWKMVANKPLDFTPGTKFGYSNTGYMILGYLLQKVTGRTYWDLVREGIFDKAGMSSSGFNFAGLKNNNRSIGYESIYNLPALQAEIVDSSYSFSAGSIYSTVGDLYKYNKALLEGRLISAASMKKAFTPVLQNYGLGWTIEYPAGKRAVFHQGAIPGFLTLMSMLPDDKSCIILMSNAQDWQTDMQRCYIELFKILINQPYVMPRLAISLPADSLNIYTGSYELKDNKAFKGRLFIKDKHLFLQWNEDKPEQLYAEKNDFFFITSYDMQLAFTRDSAGKITGFTAYVGDKQFVYQKL